MGLCGLDVDDAGDETQLKDAFRDIALKLKKYGALAYATDELLDRKSVV